VRPCLRCHRHVRGALCPFCGYSLAGRDSTGPRAQPVGVKRSALLLGAVALALSTAACGGTVVPGGPGAEVVPPPPDVDADAPDASATDAAPDSRVLDARPLVDSRAACDPDVMAPATDYGIPPGPPCPERD
jgi:hypothetical protein